MSKVTVVGAGNVGATCANVLAFNEVADEVYNLNDCGTELDDAAVQFDIWLLESNGYGEKAQELRELDWR